MRRNKAIFSILFVLMLGNTLKANEGLKIFCGNPVKTKIDEISEHLIKISRSAYEKPCPCPYDIKSDGKPCGSISAHSKSGGDLPKCFKEDIKQSDINLYKKVCSQ